MDVRVRAGIDLYGTSLRYAEVERYGTEHRLLRLGSCDFDFDVTRALWGTDGLADAQEGDQQIETLGEAIADVYENTSAEELCVVVHPPQVHSFFAPALAQTAEAERGKRFRREAQLLARSGARPAGVAGEAPGAAPLPGDEALHVRADGLYAEEGPDGRREWFHVLALDGGAHARFQHVMESLPLPAFRWTVSMEGAARAAVVLEHRRRAQSAERGRREVGSTSSAPFTLAVGRYPEHLEFALCRHGRFHYALHAPRAAPADSAYYVAALMDRLGAEPAAVGRVFVYGFDDAPDHFAVLGALTAAAPQSLDFRPIVGLDPDRLAEDFQAGAYVPCIGAAL